MHATTLRLLGGDTSEGDLQKSLDIGVSTVIFGECLGNQPPIFRHSISILPLVITCKGVGSMKRA